MAFKNDGLLIQEYVYDFAVDGGATGQIELQAKVNKDPLPEGAVVSNVYAKVITACTSGGSATVSWGDGTDVDGYSGTAKAVAALTANAAFDGKGDSGALLPDVVGSAGKFTVDIAVAALTAGKIVFLVEYIYPSVEA